MKYIPLIGRTLFALLFLHSAPGHFEEQTIGYAAMKGVPAASLMVPFSGILEALGAISIIIGYKAKWGAWILVAFLLPVTFLMHNFWTITDPMMRQMDMVSFLKNLSLIGGALMISYFGAGEVSVDRK